MRTSDASPQDLTTPSEATHIRHPDHRCAHGVTGRQIHLRANPPVVVAGRIIEDLAHQPPTGLLFDLQQQGPPRGCRGAHLVVFVEIGRAESLNLAATAEACTRAGG